MKFIILALCLIATGCANTQYSAFEGKNAVFEGSGGTKEVVGGVDFWSFGEPPRKYKLIGVIQDSRSAGIISMATFKTDVAKQAKAVGGDAVIQLSSGSEITGYLSNANVTGSSSYNMYGNSIYGQGYASGFGTTTAVRKNKAAFAVIKYVGK